MNPQAIRLYHVGYHNKPGQIYRFYTIRLKWDDGGRMDFPSEEHANAYLEGRPANFVSNIKLSSKVPVKKEEVIAEATEFNVMLNSYGVNKVPVIKVVREITSLGLRDAKNLVESAPVAIQEGLEKEQAEKTARKLKELGAEVEVVSA